MRWVVQLRSQQVASDSTVSNSKQLLWFIQVHTSTMAYEYQNCIAVIKLYMIHWYQLHIVDISMGNPRFLFFLSGQGCTVGGASLPGDCFQSFCLHFLEAVGWHAICATQLCVSCVSCPIGSMYGIYTNIGGILMVNVTIYTIHGSYACYDPSGSASYWSHWSHVAKYLAQPGTAVERGASARPGMIVVGWGSTCDKKTAWNHGRSLHLGSLYRHDCCRPVGWLRQIKLNAGPTH